MYRLLLLLLGSLSGPHTLGGPNTTQIDKVNWRKHSAMKLATPLLMGLYVAQAAVADSEQCLVCEFTGFAASEENAWKMLSGEEFFRTVNKADGTEIEPAMILRDLERGLNSNPQTTDRLSYSIVNPCIAGALSQAFDEAVATGTIIQEESDYCVATFFVYHAKDINRYVYGVKRFTSTSEVTGTQTDLSHYEGVKGWITSTKRLNGNVCGNVPGRGESLFADYQTLNMIPANPRFTKRGTYQRCMKNDDKHVDELSPEYGYQVFAMDGREAEPSDKTDRLADRNPTVSTVQSFPHTLCLVCTGSEEFTEQPKISSDITVDCWNPSGSSVYKTDDNSARNPNMYCVPNNGLCQTSTWQYATKNSLQVTSYWVGISRGCQSDSATASANVVSFTDKWREVNDGFAHGTNRAADNMEKFVRYYVASNTASKAKDLAKYPDSGTNSGSTVGTVPFAFGAGQKTPNDARYLDGSKANTVGTETTVLKKVYVGTEVGYDAAGKDDATASDDVKNLGTQSSPNQHFYYTYGWVGGKMFVGDNIYNLKQDDGFTACAAATTVAATDILYACILSLEQPMTPQFMSSDGNGPPDLPRIAAAVSELECLSCITPIGNTNSENNCVTAKTELTVKCKTLACAAVVSNYKFESGETAETYYYAKRGCAADPDDGISTGDQTQADQYVIPAGYTEIKQTNQRVIAAKANTLQASSTSVATIMDCYSCSVHMTDTVTGINPSEATYDSIKTQDNSLCWETFPPHADSSIPATGTSGRCDTSCYVEAYKYRVSTGPSSNPTTTFHWHLERGCLKADSKKKDGTVQSKDLFGVTITNYLCDWRNGTLCNARLESYDTTLQVKTQKVSPIQCYTCETPSGNTDSSHECYTVPSTAKATDCGDLSFVSCSATETSFINAANVTNYEMVRGCSKEPAETKQVPVEGYENVMAQTTICSTSSCNKVAGSTDGLVVAVVGSTPAGTESSDGNTPESSALSTVLTALALVFTLTL